MVDVTNLYQCGFIAEEKGCIIYLHNDFFIVKRGDEVLYSCGVGFTDEERCVETGIDAVGDFLADLEVLKNE